MKKRNVRMMVTLGGAGRCGDRTLTLPVHQHMELQNWLQLCANCTGRYAVCWHPFWERLDTGRGCITRRTCSE